MDAKTDLTAQFRTQRLSQIESLRDRADQLQAMVAAGEAKDLGDGRIMVTKGYDRGEIWNVSGEPQTGITINAQGNAEFYASAARPWHPLGTYFEDGLYSAAAALKAAKMDKLIIRLARSAFVVEDQETGEETYFKSADDMFQVIRMDTMESLGQVGKVYTPIQALTAFQWMERLGMPFESMGTFRGGRRMFASAKCPDDLQVSTAKGVERIQLYVFAIAHNDGNGGLKLGVAPYRIECENTERMALRNTVTSWTIRHTANHELRLDDAERSLGLVHRYAEEWTADQNRLAATPISKSDVAAVIADLTAELWPSKDDKEDGVRKERKMERRVLDIMERLGIEMERCGETAYALERALTGHLDHAGERRPRGDLKAQTPLAALGAAIMEDTDGAKKAAAHRRVLELVKR